MRSLVFVGLFMFCGAAAAAGPAQDFAQALQKKDAKAAAKLVTPALRYGADGRDATLPTPPAKALGALFKTLEKTFKDQPTETYDCTQAGRELGYMATEWKDVNEALATWARGLAERHCDGTEPTPPRFVFIKRVDGDHPHAVVLIEGGADTPELRGFYHF